MKTSNFLNLSSNDIACSGEVDYDCEKNKYLRKSDWGVDQGHCAIILNDGLKETSSVSH